MDAEKVADFDATRGSKRTTDPSGRTNVVGSLINFGDFTGFAAKAPKLETVSMINIAIRRVRDMRSPWPTGVMTPHCGICHCSEAGGKVNHSSGAVSVTDVPPFDAICAVRFATSSALLYKLRRDSLARKGRLTSFVSHGRVPMRSIALRIRRARARVGMSQSQLAVTVGVQRSAVAQWESQASGTYPNVENLVRIALCTGVLFEWLATGRGPSSPLADEFESVALDDFARDANESRALELFRQLPQKKQRLACAMLELFQR